MLQLKMCYFCNLLLVFLRWRFLRNVECIYKHKNRFYFLYIRANWLGKMWNAQTYMNTENRVRLVSDESWWEVDPFHLACNHCFLFFAKYSLGPCGSEALLNLTCLCYILGTWVPRRSCWILVSLALWRYSLLS